MAYVTYRSISQQDTRPSLLSVLNSCIEVASVVCAFGFVLALVVGAL
jgi:hypothetical protein